MKEINQLENDLEKLNEKIHNELQEKFALHYKV